MDKQIENRYINYYRLTDYEFEKFCKEFIEYWSNLDINKN